MGFFDWIGDALGLNKGNAALEAARTNSGLVRNYGRDATSLLDKVGTTVGGYLDSADDLAGNVLGKSPGMYADALGLNGAGGQSRARNTFQTGPGYEFQMEQGLDALDRRAASRGMLQSGNTNLDTLKFSQGLADQEWGSWLDRVGSHINQGANRKIGTLGDMGTLAQNLGSQKLGVLGDVASGYTAANNQTAGGKEAGQGWLLDGLGTVANIGGQFMGMGGGFPGFGKGGMTSGGVGTNGNSGFRFGYGG